MLAEWAIALKRAAMRRLLSLLVILAIGLGPAACRRPPEGSVRVVVIDGEPRLRDPASGPLSPSEAVLAQNVAQGLVAFDPAGNIVAGLAERWTVSDDGLSYIFRLAPANWPGGGKITAHQVTRIFKRQLAPRSRNSLKDTLGAVLDVVAMTDRVVEIRLLAPRPNLLPLLAQPEMAIVRNGHGTGPFTIAARSADGLRLVREIGGDDEEEGRREDLVLAAAEAPAAVAQFASGSAHLVTGGTFADLPYARRIRLPRNSLRFDPASGLLGLQPLRTAGPLAEPELRQLLSAALDRETFVAALGVPGLAPRATLLEPGLDGIAAPVAPAWTAVPLAERRASLRARAERFVERLDQPLIRVRLPEGPGADLLLRLLVRDWGALGFTVERATGPADFALVDLVAPSSSPAWFVRRFRCGLTPVCDSETDGLLEAARTAVVPAQRYALLGQAAGRVDERQLFIPITAPVRWSLVSRRIQGFAGNRYARHTLVGLERKDRDLR